MKRIIAVCLSIMLIAALLCACGGSKNYKDGTYTGQSQIFKGDEEGNGDGYGVVTLTIKDNTITACEFKTYEPGKVKMYTCGPTVYHYAHIGNLRTYIMEDVLDKYFRYQGYDVTRVMNITDVGHLSSDGDTGEDKMLKGAKRENKTVLEIAKFYTDAFFADCEKLKIKIP